MEYSPDDIAAARSVQFTTYIYVSIATFWAYDYACSLHEEWDFLLQSKWGKIKYLYIVTRYLPLILLTTILYQHFLSHETSGEYRRLNNIVTGTGIVHLSMHVLVDGWYFPLTGLDFFILRTYVLWNNNKILLAAMLSTFFAFSVVAISVTLATDVPSVCTRSHFSLAFHYRLTILSTSTVVTSAIPGITGSYRTSSGIMLFLPYLLLSVFELGLMILTLIPAMQSWRMHSGRLQVVLAKHNIFYYMCGFLLSLANVLMSLLLHYSYTGTLYAFQFIILAILATRMHLHLWRTSRYTDGYDTFVHIPMSDMSSVN
ncbi:hypothetical protein BDR07DRAFT_1497442 [Suillus spraguei]|nr:hypothetical protein BDR07DRAFT_1497442 [Suillus spraguei]